MDCQELMRRSVGKLRLTWRRRMDHDGTPRTLAEKLDRLFRIVRPKARDEYTYEEVASAIRERGVMISHTYIWQLRKGARDNPTLRHLEALAEFFGVSPSYFFDEAASRRIDEQLELLVAFQDDG